MISCHLFYHIISLTGIYSLISLISFTSLSNPSISSAIHIKLHLSIYILSSVSSHNSVFTLEQRKREKSYLCCSDNEDMVVLQKLQTRIRLHRVGTSEPSHLYWKIISIVYTFTKEHQKKFYITKQTYRWKKLFKARLFTWPHLSCSSLISH